MNDVNASRRRTIRSVLRQAVSLLSLLVCAVAIPGCELLSGADEEDMNPAALAALLASLGPGIAASAPRTPTTIGDLVISEIQYNPAEAPENNFEWVELYNPNATTWIIQNCQLEESQGSGVHPIASAVVISAGQYATLAASAAPGGFTPNYNYNASLFWVNTGETVTLRCGGTVIDDVDYSTGGFPVAANGQSIALKPGFLSSTANNTGANWCVGTNNYNGGNFGSPGAANSNC